MTVGAKVTDIIPANSGITHATKIYYTVYDLWWVYCLITEFQIPYSDVVKIHHNDDVVVNEQVIVYSSDHVTEDKDHNKCVKIMRNAMKRNDYVTE